MRFEIRDRSKSRSALTGMKEIKADKSKLNPPGFDGAY